MKKLIIPALALASLAAAWTYAQSSTATTVAIVVTTCGSGVIYLAGRDAPLTVDVKGQTC